MNANTIIAPNGNGSENSNGNGQAPNGSVLVCGGGAHNATLLRMLSAELAPRMVATTGDRGVAAEHVEALAFAWLAREALAGRVGNLAAVTGAQGGRILGAIYPR